MIYLCCDTNIVIRYLTQGRPGCEPEHFESLKDVVQGDVARLLVPEVVLLELQKHYGAFPKIFETRIKEFRDCAIPNNLWNELEDVGKSVLNCLDDKLKEKKAWLDQGYSSLCTLFSRSEVKIIRFTPEILFQAKRRLIAGQMPRPEKRSENDAILVESLRSFFETEGIEGHDLYFCTENCHDFAIELVSDAKARRRVIHPMLQEGLPPTKVFVDLKGMMAFAQGYDTFSEPTTEEVAEAVRAFEATHRSEEDDELLRQILLKVRTTDIDPALLKPTLHHMEARPEYVRSIWKSLVNEVLSLSEQCQACRSWDERSAMKLPEWLEYVDLNLIPFISLPRLVRLRNNLAKYLEIHREADRKLEAD